MILKAGRADFARHGAAALIGSFLFGRASASENVDETVIAFVAGILKDGTGGLAHESLAGPWLGPGARIVDCEAIDDSVVAHAREALDDVQFGARENILASGCGRSTEIGFRVEIGGIHYQS